MFQTDEVFLTTGFDTRSIAEFMHGQMNLQSDPGMIPEGKILDPPEARDDQQSSYTYSGDNPEINIEAGEYSTGPY